jgi:hypothetical protein
MTDKTGAEILEGDEIKSENRWWKIISIPFPVTMPRDVLAEDTKGRRHYIKLFPQFAYKCRKSASFIQYRPYQTVIYSTAVSGFKSVRSATVIEDNGGPRVKIRWQTAEGPKVARNVVAYHGHTVEHWTDRNRLSA